ncbi:hypothetical protein LU631_05925 [Erwinia tracheiphila]|uniref:Uncharacterized protein n=1 Tax=Erwinia tracheiphila TaxID=65700 RepID=A0A0M2KJI0_9GAMM|nr:hypothetical protein [Erwinia tracheiphila]AXF78411.1 hypothetical protein AV903_24270 [Erwinia tracheiphila]EOS95786.1 major facilitator superfamily protein [Erwinia tracheiphila PSU-1]KKF37462.1 hypothetical protein SY86_21970 [Erwinia tracheiphila]UIA82857.1 hypothetical protein LU604_20875 [Erwinia tracheiphila]UIA88862.1 hypothetical protein LU631_05925 [Erwinia tracheiphila]
MPPVSRMRYPTLLASMHHLWCNYPSLRRATLAQALLSVGFSTFWSTLAVMLHNSWQLGSAILKYASWPGVVALLTLSSCGSMLMRWREKPPTTARSSTTE